MMIELVTDRTQHHVTRLKQLRSIGWNNMSESQKAEYRGYAARGAYNYTDLNRVESAVAELSQLLGLGLKTNVYWDAESIPSRVTSGSLLNPDRYLNNVVAIRDACATLTDEEFPPLPESMEKLTYEGANNIEKVLEIAYRCVSGDSSGVLGKGVLGKMVLGKE
jgi:hypothetical protein